MWIQGLAIGDCLAGRDPVAGTVYLAPLGVFAVMPLFVASGRTREALSGNAFPPLNPES